MRDLRVALFTGNYHHIRDGVSLTLNRLVEFLEEQGIKVLIFGPSVKKPAFRHNGKLIAVPSVPVPGRPEYRISTRLSKKAKAELTAFNPDLIHIATPDLLGYKALKWGIRHKKTIVSSYHTHFTGYLKYYRLGFMESLGWKYLRWFYGQCRQIYIPTPSMADTLHKNGIDGDLRIWARGVDTKLFNPDKRDEQWRKNHGLGPEDIVVSYISRLVLEKNPGIYAETVKILREQNPSVKPMVVGEGPARKELQEILPDAVYTGFLTGSELANAYAGSDIFLFPSDTETFGNVTLEAMSSGLPCVVANAVGSKSLVENGVNGYLVEVLDSDAFVSKVKTLVQDRELRIRMGKASREKAKTYAWERINQQLLDYYEEALNSENSVNKSNQAAR
ncbi:MAG: glycosyltransferase family 1 protein [Balneolaceae bacterium]